MMMLYLSDVEAEHCTGCDRGLQLHPAAPPAPVVPRQHPGQGPLPQGFPQGPTAAAAQPERRRRAGGSGGRRHGRRQGIAGFR